MRLMMMHKNDKHSEAGEIPPPELIAKMGEFIGEFAADGRFIDGAGLGRSATRTRLTFRDGKASVKHGPYAGENELPSAMLLLKVTTREQAIGWAERYGKILGDGEIELGPLNEPWDLGLMPKPADAPLQVLMLVKADADSEAGRPPKQKADLSRLQTEMTKAGVLVSARSLKPSSEGKRLNFTNNKLAIMDGPFTESKELIGGFVILDLPSIEVAIETSRRYAAILGGTLNADIRLLADADEAA